MKITLYTTHCPQCDVLENILNENKIEFETITDTGIMREKHILSVPLLEVGDQLLNMQDAMNWIRNEGGDQC